MRLANNDGDFNSFEAGWCIYASVIWAYVFHVMACRLYVAKPLSEPMLAKYQLDH